MKKMSLSLLTAATLSISALSIAAPVQAATAPATSITPNIQYSYVWVHFDTYPPMSYYDDTTGFQGTRVKAVQNADGSYEGEYYGSTQI